LLNNALKQPNTLHTLQGIRPLLNLQGYNLSPLLYRLSYGRKPAPMAP
jgi:hypothetical protein